MRRLAGQEQVGCAIAAVAASLVFCSHAGAALTLTEDVTQSNSGRQFRVLEIRDRTDAANAVGFLLSPVDGLIYIQDRAGIASVPASCTITTYPPIGPGFPGATPAAACTRANYDAFFVDTGPGNDGVSPDFPYPALSRKEVIGPKILVPMIAALGPGNDTYRGLGSGSDSVFGEGGRDRIGGGAASDFLVGGKGRDRITGNDGDDFLIGGGGADLLKAGGGRGNLMLGGGGRDICSGSPGDRVGSCERLIGGRVR